MAKEHKTDIWTKMGEEYMTHTYVDQDGRATSASHRPRKQRNIHDSQMDKESIPRSRFLLRS